MKKKLFKLIPLLLVLLMSICVSVNAFAGDDAGTSYLSNLKFAADANGETLYPVTPDFQQDTMTYSITVPDYKLLFYTNASVAKDGDKILAAYPNSYGGTTGTNLTPGTWGGLTFLRSDNAAASSFKLRVGASPSLVSTTDTIYTVNIQRAVTLQDLVVNNTLTPAFNKDNLTYTAGVPADATTLDIKATAYQTSYSLRVGNTDTTSGTASTINLNWDANGRMEVPIVVSCDGAVSTTYKLILIKETAGDTPLFSVQPSGATYFDNNTNPAKLSVKATANGTLSYQWYSNTTNSNENGTPIAGATAATCTPVIANVGTASQTTYYYCVVTNTKDDNSTYTATSNPAAVVLNPDPTPTVSITTADGSAIPDGGYNYTTADTSTATLKANVNSRAAGGTYTYAWRYKSSGGYSAAAGTNNQATYTLQNSADGSRNVYCYVSYTYKGVKYSVDSSITALKVTATSAQVPTISTQPVSATYLVGTTDVAILTIAASRTDGGKLTYQWYSSTDNTNFTAISDATSATYKPSSSNVTSTVYYYCKVINTVTSSNGNVYTSEKNTDTATISFKGSSDVGCALDGEGSKTSPYLIKTQADLIGLRNLVNSGYSFQNYYFKLTADITLPDDWVPIGSLKAGQTAEASGVNIWPFSGTLDGDNHLITVPENGLPLFGYVRFATIKNLQIYGTKIAGYGLVNKYSVDYGITGNYNDYITNGYPITVAIDHVTLKSGSKTKASGFIGGYASGSNVVYITNSVIEKNVVIGYDKDQDVIGSFAGAFNGYVSNCVSDATVYGKSYVGGLVGNKGQSMGPCSVVDSIFHGKVIASGNYAAGILSSGYGSASAPNTPCASIQNCYVDGSVIGADYVAGISGGEPACTQCWANGIGYIQNNCFVGSVKATTKGAKNIGGIIAYMKSLDRYNIISNNYYLDSCGANQGIGTVVAIDKTATTRYNRTDDPTGLDADKLTKAVSATQLSDGTVLALLNSGINSHGIWTQGQKYPVFDNLGNKVYMTGLTVSGYKTTYAGGASMDLNALVITASYSDGTTQNVSANDVTVTGFENDLKDYKKVIFTYNNHTYIAEIQITSYTDLGYVLAAKAAIQAVNYNYPITSNNTQDLVQTAIQTQINALTLNGVTPSVAVDSFTPAVAVASENPTGTPGPFKATVTLTKNAATDTIVINGTVSDYAGDVVAAKNAVSGATYTYAMGAGNTKDSIKTLIQNQVNALDLRGATASVLVNTDTFVPAVAGKADDLSGTNGIFTAAVTLTKGSVTNTVTISGTIAAIAYDYTSELGAAKTAVSAATYSYSMAKANTQNKIETLIQNQIDRLGLTGITASVGLYNFNPAVSGTSSNVNGTAGNFLAIVTLTKDSSSDTVTINGTITPIAYSGTSEKNITVTFRLIGATLSSGDIDLVKGDYKGSKYVTWIKTVSYSLSKDSTMYDLLTKALSDAGLKSEGAKDNYVETIYAPVVLGGYELSEFTNGNNSGWMYTVNGSHPDVGLKDYVLSNGDKVVWHYVNDYAYEVEDWVGDKQHPAKGDGTYYNAWLKASDANPTKSSATDSSKDDSKNLTVAPTVTASNGSASVNIDASALSSIITNAKTSGAAIVIAPAITGTVKNVSVELPKASMASVANDTKSDLKVQTSVGNVTIPNATLSSIVNQATGSTVSVSLNTVSTTSLSAEQQTAVGNNKVYDISITSGDKHISSFNGTVTVSLPYTLKAGESADGIMVWYLNDSGKLEQMACTYDKNTGLATFKTTHMSYYLVGYDQSSAWTNPYGDVSASKWYYDAVKYISLNKLMSGTTATAFAPDTKMTRAMLVTVLYRLDGATAVTASNSFSDVKAGEWYTEAVKWASANKIIAGYSATLFGTNNSITREQLAVILYNYAKYKGYDVSKTSALTAYTDASSVHSWANTAMKWAVGEGLISGATSTQLSPAANATRAQVAAILMRFVENIAK